MVVVLEMRRDVRLLLGSVGRWWVSECYVLEVDVLDQV